MKKNIVFIYGNISGQSHSFNSNSLQTIKNRKLSDIICDNTNIREVPDNVFLSSNNPSNNIKRCQTNAVNHLDLNQVNLILITPNGIQYPYKLS